MASPGRRRQRAGFPRCEAWLARLVRQPRTRIEDLTETVAKVAGELCGRAGTSDVVDASVVVCAQRQPGLAVRRV